MRPDPGDLRPSPEDLQSFLVELPDTDFDTGRDFESIAIPSLLSNLGYDDENVFYEVTTSVEQRLEYTDAMVAEDSTSKPRLILEAVYYPSESTYPNKGSGVDKQIHAQLKEYHHYFDPEFTVLISNYAIGIYDGNQIWEYELEDLEIEEAQEIFDLAKPPRHFPKAPLSAKVKPQKSHIETSNFHLNIDDYEKQLQAVYRAESNQEKKETLEDMAAMLIEGVKNFDVRDRNLEPGVEEIDIVGEDTSEGRYVNCEGKYFLVECKNWSNKVGAREVRDFRGKMDDKHVNLGLIFAKQGLTGTEDGENAWEIIHNAFKSDGKVIIVFKKSDWEQILDGGVSFYKQVEHRIYNRRFHT